MKIFGGGRRSGKTSELIRLCHESEANGDSAYIVCHSEHEARRIFQQAVDMGKSISFPITYQEFRDFHGYPIPSKFYVDEAQYLLSWLVGGREIEAASFNIDEVLNGKTAS